MLQTDFLIIGGGITGLSLASFLEPKDYILLEKENELGGYCRTIKQGEFTWDYSGHFFHFKNQEIKKYLLENMEDNVYELKKKSSIYYSGKLIDFPFQENIHQLKILEFLECFYGILTTKKNTTKNFEQFVLNNLGKPISDKFVIPYNKKLYSCELNELDVDCMGRFFPKPMKIIELLKRIFSTENKGGYNDTFLYPKNGAYEFIKSLYKRLDKEKIYLNTELISLDVNSKIAITNKGKIKYKKLINTTPFNQFNSFFQNKTLNLSHNKVIVFNMGFDKGTKIKDNWIYFPGDEIFYRVGFYNNLFNSDKMSLYVEIGTPNQSDVENYPTVDKVINDLKKVGIVNEHKLIEFKKLVLNPAYVHITKESNKIYEDWSTKYNPQGYFSIGRYGQWTYCSMEDNIIQAKELSEKIVND